MAQQQPVMGTLQQQRLMPQQPTQQQYQQQQYHQQLQLHQQQQQTLAAYQKQFQQQVPQQKQLYQQPQMQQQQPALAHGGFMRPAGQVGQQQFHYGGVAAAAGAQKPQLGGQQPRYY